MAAGLRATAPRIPFGAERRGTFTPPEPHPTCHDCGVRPGELHSEGCDVEECETCGGQRIGCYCCHVCRAHEKHGTWSVCAECIALAKQARLRGAPTPAMIAAALDGLKIAHQVVEDCWYSCPKARDADGDSECCNDAISDGACNCGADAHNAKVEALRAALTAQEGTGA